MGLACSVDASPITTAIEFLCGRCFRTAIETGDLDPYPLATLCTYLSQTLFVRNDPLDAVCGAKAEMALDSSGRPGFRERRRTSSGASNASSRPLQGGPRTFFHLHAMRKFRRGDVRGPNLTADRMAQQMVCYYWIVKTEGRGVFLSGGLRRGARGSRQGEAAALGRSRSDPATRLLLLHRA